MSLGSNYRGILGSCRTVKFAVRASVLQEEADVVEAVRSKHTSIAISPDYSPYASPNDVSRSHRLKLSLSTNWRKSSVSSCMIAFMTR